MRLAVDGPAETFYRTGDLASWGTELAFVELLGTIITGAPAYAHRYGREFWADIDARPELRLVRRSDELAIPGAGGANR